MRLPSVCSVVLFLCAIASAQLPRPVIARLQSLARPSGIIFNGQVKDIRLLPATNGGSAPVVEITFQVEQGYRGVQSGEQLVIREWAGLWQSGQSYRRGERVLLFLYAPSKLGLTSVVGGASGRFVMDSGGRIVVRPHPVGISPGTGHLPESIPVIPRDFARALSAEME